MQLNYILLVHKGPAQLKKLVQRLYENWTFFYIHIDSNTDITPFKEVLSGFKQVKFLKDFEQYPGIWGDIGIIKGTLAAMRSIITDGRNGYTILLSGQDYPLANNKNILGFFKNNETNYIDITPVETLWKKHGRDRITKYKINKSNQRGHFLLLPSIFDKDFYRRETLSQLNYLRKIGKFETLLKIFIKRKFPANLKASGGSQWWALKNTTIKIILHFIENDLTYIKYHKYSLLPDEMFFHSIISSIQEKEKLKVSNSITYVNWKSKSGPLPVTFKKSDFNELKKASENHFFARKFDMEMDNEILDDIDKNLLN